MPRPLPPKETLGHTCLDFSPSSRHHALASTFLRSFPGLRIRFVLRFSQPLDAFLRTRARGPISSRCHVQSSPVQGVLLSRSHLSSSERACPLAVVPDALTTEAVSVRRSLDFEAFIRARVRCFELRLFIAARARCPPQVFLLRVLLSRRAPVLLGCSALDVSCAAFAFALAAPGHLQRLLHEKIGRLISASANPPEFSSLPSENPKILFRRGSLRFGSAASSRHRQTLNYSSHRLGKNAREKNRKIFRRNIFVLMDGSTHFEAVHNL